MGTWRDLADVVGLDAPKVLPIMGKEVAFPGRISAWAGGTLLAITAAAEAGATDPDEITETVGITEADAVELEAEILGDDGAAALDAAGVIGTARRHVVNTLMAWHISGEEAAREAWEAGGKAPRPNRAARRATAGRSSAGTSKGTKGSGVSRAASGASSARRTGAGTRRGSSGTGSD